MQTLRKRSLLAPLALAVAMATNTSYAASPSERPGIANMLQQVTPAIVNIAVKSERAAQSNPLLQDPNFRRFFNVPDEQPREQGISVGSGVIIDAGKGYILTNNHVVEDATEIEVTLQDKRRLTAKLLGRDEGTDIALLQVEAKNLIEIPQANSDSLQVGDYVVAIGNPFGLGQTVTTGIVSALDRQGISRDGYEDFIQTDASINPGNSGGALVDYEGNLIGINSAIISPGGGGNVGIGFAVPINMAKAVVDQLEEFGEVQRGRLGVMVQDLTPDVAEALDVKLTSGAVVASVEPGSAAQKAGVEVGDIITRLNGKDVESSSDLRNGVGLTRAGTSVELELLRGDEKLKKSVVVSSGQNQRNTAAVAERGATLDGVRLQEGRGGVEVSEVAQNSRAWASGLRPGDVITAVNRKAVSKVAELEASLPKDSRTFALRVRREGENLLIIIH
jgi:serine protease DegQ